MSHNGKMMWYKLLIFRYFNIITSVLSAVCCPMSKIDVRPPRRVFRTLVYYPRNRWLE